jgi:hypothetical protein
MLGLNVTWTPCAAATLVKYLCVPPYTSLIDTTCEPAASDWSITAVVEEPEAKASAYLACSSAAIAVSKLSRLGFDERVYS